MSLLDVSNKILITVQYTSIILISWAWGYLHLKGVYAFIFLLFVCHLAGSTVLQAGELGLRRSHVVLLVLDGERYSETWGSPGWENIPKCSTMASEGTLLTHLYNDGWTYTLPGHCSLLTGHNDELQGTGKDLPSHPSLFQLLLADGAAVNQAWLVTSKEKLKVLVNCSDPAWKDRWIARTDCGTATNPPANRADAETMARAREILLEHQPRFLAINLKDPDIAAHQRDKEGYLKGIRDCDELAANFWLWLQAQPAFKDSTTLIITNDHGRHVEGRMEGFVSHGDGCSGCRHIGCLILGLGIKRDSILNDRYSQRDLAATLAIMLDLELLKSKGAPIMDVFTNPPAKQPAAGKN